MATNQLHCIGWPDPTRTAANDEKFSKKDETRKRMENSRARFFNDYRVYCNASAWQTKVTFEKEMDIINNKMVREDRQLLIILDNVSTHKLGKTYSNIRLEFMMPNTTPQIQPLHQFFFCLSEISLQKMVEFSIRGK